MKDFYISDCTRHENKIITSNFVVVSKQIKPKKTGEPYLALTLGDRSGQLEAKMWDNVEEVLNAFEQDDFLKIKGLVNKYKNRFQLTIHKLRKLGESEIEFADYLPKTTREHRRTLADSGGFRRVLPESSSEGAGAGVHVRSGNRRRVSQRSRRQDPASRLYRRPARPCGLAFSFLRPGLPKLSAGESRLLLTGAFLHDIGKIHELAYNRSFSYTTRGQLARAHDH